MDPMPTHLMKAYPLSWKTRTSMTVPNRPNVSRIATSTAPNKYWCFVYILLQRYVYDTQQVSMLRLYTRAALRLRHPTGTSARFNLRDIYTQASLRLRRPTRIDAWCILCISYSIKLLSILIHSKNVIDKSRHSKFCDSRNIAHF